MAQVDDGVINDAVVILAALRQICRERQDRYNLHFLTEGEHRTLNTVIDGLGGVQPNHGYGIPDWTGSLKAALLQTR